MDGEEVRGGAGQSDGEKRSHPTCRLPAYLHIQLSAEKGRVSNRRSLTCY